MAARGFADSVGVNLWLSNLKNLRKSSKYIIIIIISIILNIIGKETSLAPVSSSSAYGQIRRFDASSDVTLPFLSRIWNF